MQVYIISQSIPKHTHPSAKCTSLDKNELQQYISTGTIFNAHPQVSNFGWNWRREPCRLPPSLFLRSYNLQVAKEFVSCSVTVDELDGTDGPQNCYNSVQDDDSHIDDPHQTVFGFPNCQIRDDGDDEVQGCEANCSAEGHKVSEEWYGRSDESDYDCVHGGDTQSRQPVS